MKNLRFGFPLFWKFSIAIIIIVFVFGSINSILIYKNVQTSLRHETEKRGMFIAKSITSQITTLLLFEDYVGLENTLNNIKNIDDAIDYIFILDSKNELIVHTFPDEFPSDLIHANTLGGKFNSHSQLLQFHNQKDQYILDIAMPILSGKIGVVRVGVKESFIKSDVQKTINVFWIMVGVFLIFGIIGALVFAIFITRPIKEIQNVVDSMDLSQIGSKQLPLISIRKKMLNKIPMIFRAEDEIDILAEKYNDMIQRLDKAYQELQRTQLNLIQSEKLATVGTLTTGLAHEINNPVAGLQNCIRRISNDPENLAQNKKYLIMMENAIERIDKIVSSFLNFTRKQETVFSDLYLESIIENTLILLSHRLEQSRVTISKNFHQHLPPIKGNKNQLEQVLLNLMINSLDSIQDRIAKEPETARKIDFSGELFGTNIILKVTDSGNGISKSDIDKVFDPFFTTKAPGKGTGLGLSVVYNIIKSHNGEIKFESMENTGTSVSIIFPTEKVGFN